LPLQFLMLVFAGWVNRHQQVGERHLRHAVKEYTEHYHIERNHQRLDNRLIEERQGVVEMNSAIERHERLGGVLNSYERRAA
jgi:hypothetical protein